MLARQEHVDDGLNNCAEAFHQIFEVSEGVRVHVKNAMLSKGGALIKGGEFLAKREENQRGALGNRTS